MIYLALFLEFLKIGLFTFGGGYAMIPLIKETVLKYNWMSESDFLNMIGLSEVTPGPIAINMATFIGEQQGGLLGSAIATIAVILPAFIIMLLIAIILKKVVKNKVVQSALKGIRPVAIALIFSAGITLFIDVLFPYTVNNGNVTFSLDITPIFIFMLIAFYCLVRKFIFAKKNKPFAVILISAAIGLIVNFLLTIPA